MDYFDDQPDLYGEPPPYADALALPAPPPPEPLEAGPPVPVSPFDAAQYLPPPPPPDAGIAAFPLGEPSATSAPGPADLPPSFAPPPPVTALPSLAAPPPLVPDAVSDASGMPASGAVGEQSYAPSLTPRQRDASMLQQYANDPLSIPDLELQQRYLNDLALRDPAKFADIHLQHEDARRKEDAARRAQIANRDYDDQMANLRARQEARAKIQQQTDQVMAEAQRLYDEKIDPTGGLNTGQKIAGVLSSIVGGLVQGRTGSARNAGLDSFNDLVNRGIEVQKANLANRRNALEFKRSALGQAYERTGDMFVAAESVRQAAFTHAIGMLDADMQNWDPRGTQAMRRAKLRADLLTNQAQSLHKFQVEQHDRDMKDRKQLFDEEKIKADIANQKATIGLGYARINEDREQRKATEKARLADKALERADKEAERIRQFSISSPRPTMLLDDKGQPVKGADGKPITTTSKFVNRDGTPWLTGDSESNRAMKDKIVAASEIADMIDEVLDIRDQVGGELMPWSDAKQRLNLLQERMRLVRKSGTQGMSSDKDFEALGASIGAKDLTSFIDQSPGLKEARGRTISELNTQMRTHNYDGPAIDFPNKYGSPAGETVDEIRSQKLRERPDESIGQASRAIESARAEGFDVGYDPGAAIYQQVGIQKLGQLAAGPADDPAATKARADLQNLAGEAPTASLRQRAKAALESALRAGVGSEEQTSTATRTGSARPAGEQSYATPVPDELRVR